MPQVLLATAAGAAITAGAVIADVLLVAGVANGLRQQRRAQKQANASLQDRTIPIRSASEPRKLVLGRTRVADVIAYVKEHGANREVQSMVVTLAAHEIDAVEDVWFNDESIGALSANAVQAGSKYFRSEPLPATDTWTAGGTGSTHQLDLQGASFLALDSLVYEGALTETPAGPNGEAGTYLAGGMPVVMAAGTDYTVSGTGLVTLSTAAANGRAMTATYRIARGEPHARVYVFRGVPAGERDTLLETWSGGEWPTTAIGRDVARLHAVFYWHETIYAAGLPAVSAVVRGARLYDPRQDSTNGGSGAHRVATPSTWTYGTHGDNPALQVAWYLMHKLGWRVASSKIHWPSVIEAANICDELVPIDGGSGTQKRYTGSGVLSTGDARKANLAAILSAMMGTAFRSGGVWYIRAAAYRTPTLSLTAEDLAEGPFEFSSEIPRADAFNCVRGTFRDPARKWQVTDFPPYRSSAYVADDNGREQWADIELPFTTDARMAQRLAKLALHRDRQAVRFTARWKLRPFAAQPGDTVQVTLPRMGWSSKVFRVVKRSRATLHTIDLELREEASAVYSATYTEFRDMDPAPNTQLAAPNFVAPIAGVTVRSDADTYYVRQDGAIVPYVEVSWTLPLAGDVRVEVYWKRAAETEYRRILRNVGDTIAWLEGVAPGETINAYLYGVNALGARSATSWLPSVVVSRGVPSGRPSISANGVRNAAFDRSTAHWRTWESGVAGVATFGLHATDGYRIRGTPSSAYLTIASALTGSGYAAGVIGSEMSVAPGDRVVVFSDVIGWGTDALVQVAFRRADGSWIETRLGNLVAGVAVESPSRRFDRPDHHQTSAVIAVAPPGTAYAEPMIVGAGNWSADALKYVSVHKPFIGRLPAGVSTLPPWDPGGHNVVDTPDIAERATDDVYVQRLAAPVVVQPLEAAQYHAQLPFVELPVIGADSPYANAVIDVRAAIALAAQGTIATTIPSHELRVGLAIMRRDAQGNLITGSSVAFVSYAWQREWETARAINTLQLSGIGSGTLDPIIYSPGVRLSFGFVLVAVTAVGTAAENARFLGDGFTYTAGLGTHIVAHVVKTARI